MVVYMNSKIDKEIAEKFLGWKKDEEYKERWKTQGGLLHESYWRPTYNISDAWKVVENLEKLGDFLIAKDKNDNEWDSELTTYDDEGQIKNHYYVRHKSAQMAICLLALKTV